MGSEFRSMLLTERRSGCQEYLEGPNFSCFPEVYPTLYYNIFRPCSAGAIDEHLSAVAAITTSVENGIFDQQPHLKGFSLLHLRSKRNGYDNKAVSAKADSKDWKSLYPNLVFNANTINDLDKKLKFLILMNEDGRRVDPVLKNVDLNDPDIYDRPYFTLEQLNTVV